MGTKFFAKAGAETFGNPSHTVNVNYVDGRWHSRAPEADPTDPYSGLSRASGGEPTNVMFDFISSHGQGAYYFEVFDENPVDYSLSLAPVSIDLTRTTQHGGFAEGDSLGDIFEIAGSAFDDVLRGSNTVSASGELTSPSNPPATRTPPPR